MAPRWIGLSRPHPRSAARSRVCPKRTALGALRGLGASGVLAAALAFNWIVNPEAYAQTRAAIEIPIQFLAAFPIAPIPDDILEAAASPVPAIEADESDVRLLAATAWGEARSEGEHGMRAVAHVMVNRVGARFGEDLSTVILSPKQFSVWNRRDPNRRLVQTLVADPDGGMSNAAQWDVAQRVAREVLSGQSADPTRGALFYHTRAVRPSWARYGQGRRVIGAHIFYADVPDRGSRRTPRTVDVAHVVGAPMAGAQPGARAGRVSGVIQHAPPQVSAQVNERLAGLEQAQALARAQGAMN